MFKKVIETSGFWRSVFSLGLAFSLIFVIIKWAIDGFKSTYFSTLENPQAFVLGLVLGGFVYGFFVTFGKFRGKIKKEEEKR